MIDKRKMTVEVAYLVETWLEAVELNFKLTDAEIKPLHEAIESALEGAYRRGYLAAMNPAESEGNHEA